MSASASPAASWFANSRPDAPSSSTRRKAGRSEATTAACAAMASTSTMPKDSPPVCGAT